MALFKEGDWVQITPNKDRKWKRWADNEEFYSYFAGKVGYIDQISPDHLDTNVILYAVAVDFPYDIKDGSVVLSAGSYYCWFKLNHLSRSSKYIADRQKEQYLAGIELQKWEAFKKKSTDDALKSVFVKEKPKIVPVEINKKQEKDKNLDEDDLNLLDFLNPDNPFFYSDD